MADSPALPSAPLYQVQDYLTWFHTVNDHLKAEEERQFQACLEQLHEYRDLADELLSDIDRALRVVKKARAQCDIVKGRGSALRSECSEMMGDQQDLLDFSNALQLKLKLFDDLEYLTRSFAHASAISSTSSKSATEALSPFSVTHPEFLTRLASLDQVILGLEDLDAGSVEIAEYVVKAKQLRSRIMAHIRASFSNLLRNTTSIIQKQWADSASKPSDSSYIDISYLHVRFRAVATKIRPILAMVESNAGYKSLLPDLRYIYDTQRLLILMPVVSHALVWFESATPAVNDELTTQVKTSSMFLLHLFQAEHAVAQCFFSDPFLALQTTFDSLSQRFCDAYRPHVLALTRLNDLVDCAEIFRTEFDLEGRQYPQLMTMVSRVLGDLQERAVFRVLILAREIGQGKYVDLSSAPGLAGQSVGMSPECPPKVTSWFPPLEQSLLLLSNLHRCVDVSTFKKVAPDVIKSCLVCVNEAAAHVARRVETEFGCLAMSDETGDALMNLADRYLAYLTAQSDQLTTDPGTVKGETDRMSVVEQTGTLESAPAGPAVKYYRRISPSMHAHLFLLQCISIIHDQISPFDLVGSYTERSLTFTPPLALLSALWAGSGLVASIVGLPSRLVFETVPRVRETVVDICSELSQELSRLCDLIVLEGTREVLGPLITRMAQSGGADPSKVNIDVNLSVGLLRNILDILPPLNAHVSLYVYNKNVCTSLKRQLMTQVIQTYSHIAASSQSSISDGKMLNDDVFAKFVAEICEL